MAPRPGRGAGSGAEVNGGGGRLRWGRGGRCALLSKCINSKHMLAADTAQAVPRAELAAPQRECWEEKRGAPELARAAEGSGTGKGSGGGSIPVETPQLPAQGGWRPP